MARKKAEQEENAKLDIPEGFETVVAGADVPPKKDELYTEAEYALMGRILVDKVFYYTPARFPYIGIHYDMTTGRYYTMTELLGTEHAEFEQRLLAHRTKELGNAE